MTLGAFLGRQDQEAANVSTVSATLDNITATSTSPAERELQREVQRSESQCNLEFRAMSDLHRYGCY